MNLNAIVVVFALLLCVIGAGLCLNVILGRVTNKRVDKEVAEQFSTLRRRNNTHRRILTNYTRR